MSDKKKYFKGLLLKSIKDLVSLRNSLRKDLFSLRMKNVMRSLKQTHKIKETKKKITQIQFVLSTKIKETYGSNK